MTSLRVIPQPKHVERREGVFAPDRELVLSADPQIAATGILDVCREALEESLGVAVRSAESAARGVRLELVGSWAELSQGLAGAGEDVAPGLLDEGYELTVAGDGARVRALSPRGLYYGVATLVQLLEDSPAPALRIVDWPTFSLRGVHLDLKVQMPTTAYLRQLVRRLSLYKVNGLLVEYEDKFPYATHRDIRAGVALGAEELRGLLGYARLHEMTLVPLLQTLGHLEYVLKHDAYRHLREKPDVLSQVCPLHPGSRQLVGDLFAEIAAFHADDPFFHVGGDEAWVMGSCPRCHERAEQVGVSGLYVEYMDEICGMARDAGKVPIIWSDMLTNHPEEIARFPKDVLVNYWDYWSQWPDMSYLLWNHQRYTRENLADIPEHIRRIYDPYWRSYDEDLPFRGFPFFDFLRDHGYSVVASAATRAFGDSYSFPAYSYHIPNIVGFARASLGRTDKMICTSWAIRHAHPETTWYGLTCAADTMWNVEGHTQSDFDGRFAWRLFGLESAEVVPAFRFLSRTGEEGIRGPRRPLADYAGRAETALGIIRGIAPRVGRNHATWAQLDLAAQQVVYETKTRWELSRLEAETARLFRGSIRDEEIPGEVAIRAQAPWTMRG